MNHLSRPDTVAYSTAISTCEKAVWEQAGTPGNMGEK